MFEIKQEYQIVHITDLCNHCGNCTTFCPTSGKPFMDKPRLALSDESYRVEDNVFLPFKDNTGNGLLRKRDKTEEKIVKIGDKIVYSTESVEMVFKEHPEQIAAVIVEPVEMTEDAIQWCDLIFATGSTVVNGSMSNFLERGKPVIFYGVTVSATAKILNLNAYCH